ncbi:ribosomal small subunit assembly protein [Cladophialophora carrionii]|uniref:Ribosomal small subunit assembly protein n=1 Tax=Cladophialophora carrionii TaxID=86049 RepID=A0A1C1CLZ7_9EURO|nr:ribosomal small subunit assembly protein [Cladophialophora carrionii]
MVQTPQELGGFVVLPLRLPKTDAFPRETTHYLYLKPHDPKIPEEEAPRSLFLVNIPISTTAPLLKDLFTSKLEGGRVERVHFSDTATTEKSHAPAARSRKRKRKTVEELEAGLDTHSLPKVFDTEIHESGATAVVIFVDRPSMELSLKSARRAAKRGTPILWDDAGPDAATTPTPLGLARYERHKQLQFPSRKDLRRSVNAYMTAYSALEESRSRESARKRAEPDEDGFVTVTRGSRGSVRMDEAKEVAERQKEKSQGLEDFYRFQTRERRKLVQEDMVKRFDEDRRKVEEMRKRRARMGGS